MPLFDHFCLDKKCEHYIEWDLELETDDPTYRYYPCVSCIKVGQSYNITEYPNDCPYLNEIKKYEEDELKKETWEKLST